MKKFLVAPLLLISCMFSYSQIENEIKSYVDSTEITVENGRKLMLRELGDSNMLKVGQIYGYLQGLTEDAHAHAFYFVEAFNINLLIEDWQEVNSLMLSYEEYLKKPVYHASNELSQRLYELVVKKHSHVLSKSKDSELEEEAKRLLELMMCYLDQDCSDEDYNGKLKLYSKTYDNSDYLSFKDGFLPAKMVKGSINMSFGSGVLITTGDLADHFPANAGFNMGMDVNVNRVFTSVYIMGGNFKLQQPFSVSSVSETVNFTMNDKFHHFEGGLKGGYFLLRNERFHIAPYLNVAGGSMESMRYNDPNDNDLEYEIYNSFIYGVGLHTEVKIVDYDYNDVYTGTPMNAYFSLKIDAGYNKIAKFKDSSAVGDMPYIQCSLIMGFGRF